MRHWTNDARPRWSPDFPDTTFCQRAHVPLSVFRSSDGNMIYLPFKNASSCDLCPRADTLYSSRTKKLFAPYCIYTSIGAVCGARLCKMAMDLKLDCQYYSVAYPSLGKCLARMRCAFNVRPSPAASLLLRRLLLRLPAHSHHSPRLAR